MKTKKALGGLLGLLGSFGSFPLAGFLPPLVVAAPFLFTASLPSKSTISIIITQKSFTEREIMLVFSIFRSQIWKIRNPNLLVFLLNRERIKRFKRKLRKK